MEQIERHLNSTITPTRNTVHLRKLKQNNSISDNQNKLIGGVGTIDGRIWVIFSDKRIFSKAIIRREADLRINNGLTALRDLERGPTGYHDIVIANDSHVQLLYCHQNVVKISFGGSVSLCGRTFLVYIDDEEDMDEDECEVIELRVNQHLRLISGTINVRVSAGGHKIYLNTNNRSVNYVITSRLYIA